MRDAQRIQNLARAGIILPRSVQNVSTPLTEYAMDAADLTPHLSSTGSSGIPNYLTTYVDPSVIDILVAPMKAAELVGESKKGDWTTLVAAFITAEPTTKVATYGDYSSDGDSGTNINYPQRQSYFFQTWTRWGERELEMAGAGRVDLASELNYSSALGLAKFLNGSYLFGVAGLENYGLINDPSLSAPITATTPWSGSPAVEAVVNEVVTLFQVLQTQSQGIITQEDVLHMGLPPTAMSDLSKTNQYGLSAAAKLKDIFPKLEFVTIPEYDTASGRLVQLWAPRVEGKDTATCAFTEKMRAHSIERYSSYFRQKKSAGTWGAVIFRPFAVAQMIGV